MLAKPKNARRAGNAVGHPQVRFDLVVRDTPWPAPDEATDHAPPTIVSRASDYAQSLHTPTDWPTQLAILGAAK